MMEIVENNVDVTDKNPELTVSENKDIIDLSIQMIIDEFNYLEIFS